MKNFVEMILEELKKNREKNQTKNFIKIKEKVHFRILKEMRVKIKKPARNWWVGKYIQNKIKNK